MCRPTPRAHVVHVKYNAGSGPRGAPRRPYARPHTMLKSGGVHSAPGPASWRHAQHLHGHPWPWKVSVAAPSFSLCLATNTLPQLTFLGIGIEVAAGGCAALARCLKHLPTLNQLDVALCPNEPPPSHSGQSALTAFARPAACPATLSHLQKLKLWQLDPLCHVDAKDDGLPVSSCFLQLLPLLRAPALGSVLLESDADSISQGGLVAALATFPTLHTVEMDRWPGSFGREAVIQPGQQLTSLQALRIISTSDEVALKVAAMMVSHASASLTSLHLNPSGSDASSPSPLSDSWDALLGCLVSCKQLQSLHLASLHGMGAAAGTVDLMTRAFQHLNVLTGLSLGGAPAYLYRNERSDPPLCGEQLARALRYVPMLEMLSLETEAMIDMRGHKAQAVLDACAELPCLKELELKLHSFEIGQIATALTKLRALTLLRLSGVRGADDSVVAALRAHIPNFCMN